MRTCAPPDAQVAVLVSHLPSQQLVRSIRCRMRCEKRVKVLSMHAWHSRGNLGATAECFHFDQLLALEITYTSQVLGEQCLPLKD